MRTSKAHAQAAPVVLRVAGALIVATTGIVLTGSTSAAQETAGSAVTRLGDEGAPAVSSGQESLEQDGNPVRTAESWLQTSDVQVEPWMTRPSYISPAGWVISFQVGLNLVATKPFGVSQIGDTSESLPVGVLGRLLVGRLMGVFEPGLEVSGAFASADWEDERAPDTLSITGLSLGIYTRLRMPVRSTAVPYVTIAGGLTTWFSEFLVDSSGQASDVNGVWTPYGRAEFGYAFGSFTLGLEATIIPPISLSGDALFNGTQVSIGFTIGGSFKILNFETEERSDGF